MIKALQFAIEYAARLVYPPLCASCSKLLPRQGNGLCRPCGQELETRRLDLSATLPRPDFIEEVSSCFQYKGIVKSLLRKVKFGRQSWVLQVFRETIEEYAVMWAAELFFDAIVPVPLSKKTLLSRHFNQSECLAFYVGKKLNIPVEMPIQKIWNCPSQRGLKQEERLANIYGAFKMVPFKKAIRQKNLLLVDDILTSGATAAEAARILKENGACRIYLLTLAQTPLKQKYGTEKP